MMFTVKQNKTLNPLQILCFGKNAIVFDADTVADLIKEFGGCIFTLHEKVVTNNEIF